ncbi:NADP oxidoreductase [Pectobacterium odoriferum]|uniref:NADP oxidoreductase n=1 Tax=Pectobacterium odoriferum TaxID=78398 RepID=A0ABD6VPL8_9GAMM|nr:NAD(P)-binding domain-containing protein [Pectobacterium odoriferum]POE12086.1 NADP oxidoreductase [Pectobacterium odoriferum]POE25971.1 NADP oxidoreductase [Pectobacterium odoriferum]POE30512.1 NADP oxidoreductase [Pectobacterium odoriferum]
MKIGILGTGNIGKTLVQKLTKAGHEIKVANSRGPETIDAQILTSGARAVTSQDAMKDVDVIILSIPFASHSTIKPLMADVPEETVVIDTANYYPVRDGIIQDIENGMVESLWVAGLLGRPIAKAWNAIGARAFAESGMVSGNPDRIAIPVAADRKNDRDIAMRLVEATGFDAFDAGTLADSWRQQPGSPVYCTNLTKHEMATALDTAEKARLPKRRDLVTAVVLERFGAEKLSNSDADFLTTLNRIIYR